MWWKCKKCNYEWPAKISTKRRNKSLCPVCEVGIRFKRNVNDLLTKCPDAVLDWDFHKNKYIRPDDITLTSREKVWRKCHICGYEWKSAINVHVLVDNIIISLRKCKSCSGRVVNVGKTDLATTHPKFAQEYVPELNTIPLIMLKANSTHDIT